MGAWLQRIGTATPRHDVHQAFIVHARQLLRSERERQLLDRLAERCGIAHRYSVLEPAASARGAPDESGFYSLGPFAGTGARMALHDSAALALALQAVHALAPTDELAARLARVTHLIACTSTGSGAPGLDVPLIDALGLPVDVQRTALSAVGGTAVLAALRLARDTLCAAADASVLVVDVELASLHLHESHALEDLWPCLLLGDAASAALVGSEPDGAELLDFAARLLPASRELMTWQLGDQGFRSHQSGLVPGRIAEALIDEHERRGPHSLFGATATAPALWVVHADPAVLDAVQAARGLPREALTDSRAVLQAVGHVGAAGTLFVLRRLLRRAVPGAGGLALAFGPGISMEAMQFRTAGLS